MRELVEKTYALAEKDLIWKPLYPNNMPGNGLEGYYCLILNKDKDGKVFGRKYTIHFQHKETKAGTGCINRNEIDRYILFEKTYMDVKGDLEHPAPSDYFHFGNDGENTFTAAEVNDYGHFVYAYESLESAKKRALTHYKMIYGYAMSYLVSE